MQEIIYKPIGIIHTPFNAPTGIPIQSSGGKGISGTIEIEPEYIPCLKDLDGFSHIILIYHLHLSKGYNSEVKPFMDKTLRGVFATRAPKRPNPIGISVVKLRKVRGGILYIKDLDIIDGTPLLDIKPYVPTVDAFKTEQIGWLTNKVDKMKKKQADKRFL